MNPKAEPERLQKVLAHAGVGSRRACEDFILQGRITINGQIVRELGTKVLAGRDRVAVDGQPIHDERPAYIAVNKPKGYVSTNNDPSGRPRVVDLVPDIPQRVYTVGRLDEMSTGLLLLTNDGELANKLAHPKFGVEKIYRAVVAGNPTVEVLNKLTEGVWLAEGKVRAKRVKAITQKGDATVLEMVLAEGKNREVRRMLAKFGHKVMTLTRVAVGPITLKGLKPGGWRFLTSREVDLLRKVADGMPVPTSRFSQDRPARAPLRGPRSNQGPLGPRDPQDGPRPGGPRPYPGRISTGGARDRQDGPRDRQDGPRGPRPSQGHFSPHGSRDRQDGPRGPRPAQAGFGPRGPRDQQDGPGARGPRPFQGGPAPQHDRRPPRPDSGPSRPRIVRPGDEGPPKYSGGQRRPSAPLPARPIPPAPARSGPPARPAQRPPREETPTRKIIGLNFAESPPTPNSGRPMPGRRPGAPPPPRRRPGGKPSRPRRPEDESDG